MRENNSSRHRMGEAVLGKQVQGEGIMGLQHVLNETKREFLRDERLSNPRYWAPYVMYGA